MDVLINHQHSPQSILNLEPYQISNHGIHIRKKWFLWGYLHTIEIVSQQVRNTKIYIPDTYEMKHDKYS